MIVGVLLYVMKECTDEECATAIHDMRREIRKEFKDIRANTYVVKYLWEVIARAAEEFETDVYIDSPDAVKLPRSRTRKRARQDSDDEGATASPTKTPAKTPVKRTPKGKKRAHE